MEKDEIKQKIINRRTERRLNTCYKIVSTLVRPAFKLFYHFDFEKPVTLPKPAIILANHTTDYDPLLLAGLIKNQFYFLASENCFRKGNFSKLLVWGFAPISKIKGASDTLAVMKTIRYLKEGKSVCIFPEGGRTFNGKTLPVEAATGKLVKISGASLVTARIEGGYLTLPRWGFGRRKGGKGGWSGKIVNIYSPEKLKAMSQQEITDLISKDIYFDAYEKQAQKPIRYRGKDLAYGMECGVCVCPACKTIGSIKSKGNSVFCTSCGLSTELDEYGFFTNKAFPFKHYGEWDAWQESFYKDYVAGFAGTSESNDEAGFAGAELDDGIKAGGAELNGGTKAADTCEKPLVYDDGVSLRTINADHEEKLLGRGRFSLYLDRFVFEPDASLSLEAGVSDCQKLELPISRIPDSSVFSRTNFNFTDDEGLHYELYTDHLINDRLLNVRKYNSIWKILRNSL